jgi:Ala-tRNA(Pro) deacylase
MSGEPPGATRPGGSAVTERLERWLRERGARFRVMEHAPVFTSEEAARVRGTPIEAGAKALVFLAVARPVHVVLPGARRIDNARLRAVLGTRTLRFATHAELLALTGCVPGAVPPFGNLFGLPAFVDEALAEQEEIAFNAGSNTVSIIMRSDDFLRLSEARVHALTRPPAPGN